MKRATVISAFVKTGIHPWNPDALDPSFFAPSLNTTTEAAQPMPTQLPSILVPVGTKSTLSAASHSALPSDTFYATPSPSANAGQTSASETSPSAPQILSIPRYEICNLPPLLPAGATREELYNQIG
ncbi:uncharacterized protein PHACADRAFT_26486 [Phanerochaete carnosa HHB-10118-sp]|uniref:Uncharacterized protein n=1 Tax=Phanerochaete carnosa (strain HHB-10118-sp) TaxID=650164 RepID=K5WF60_PHACS|nr:uncharacterized protein PHACADRAFT_26486 [Phanerochaete carnosa HHB-10118-sp]EKM57915.1 hypothetical protein PHACADRAFT_26486 [Phanerochaete carnosa HHB-10118-sp]